MQSASALAGWLAWQTARHRGASAYLRRACYMQAQLHCTPLPYTSLAALHINRLQASTVPRSYWNCPNT